jgi:hypothetical protein
VLPATARPRVRQVPAVALFLLAAVAFGIAAAILAAPASGPTGGTPLFGLVSFDTGLAITLGFVAAMFVVWILMTFRRGEGVGLNRVFPTAFLLVALVLVLFIFIAPYAAHGIRNSGSSGSTPPGGQNNSTPPAGGGSGGIGGPLPGWNPGWLPVLAVGAATVVVAVLALPLLLSLRRRPPPSSTEPDVARRAVERALAALDDGSIADPRRRIVALYAQLLERVGPKIERVDARTAREVEQECVRHWKMPRASAEELTGLFEEARYSDHPMPESAVDRARAALRASLRAIDAGTHSA